MKKQLTTNCMIAAFVACASWPFVLRRALAHHSFAMYDQTKILVLTGVAYQFVAQANHAELHFYLIGPDGKLEKDKDGKKSIGASRWRVPQRWRSKALRRSHSRRARYSA